MTVQSVIQSVLQSSISPVTDRFGGAAEFIRKNAIVNLDERGIVGSTPTEWQNSGTGGSGFDRDVILGTPANLARISVNGHDSVNASGSVAIETSVGQTINFPMTIFLVAKANVLSGSTQSFTASKSISGSSPQIFISAGGNFFFDAGGFIQVAPADTNLHVHTVRHNGDPTTSYKVSGIGSVSGDAGTENMEDGTIFANHNGNNTIDGSISQYIVIPFATTDAVTANIEAYLLNKFGL